MEDLTICHQEIELQQNREISSGSKGITTTENDSDKNVEKSVYSEGEKVLAFYKHQIYEAKVEKAESRKNKWKYHVHYIGWNTKWNEWVNEDQLLKHTQENLMKRKNDVEIEKNSVSIIKKNSINIQIPAMLSKQLIDDWNFVTQQDKLVTLPRSPTIDEILTKYLQFKSKKKNSNNVSDSIEEFMIWVRRNFDRAMPMMLLYTKEQKQYSEAIMNGVSPSTIYGAEHLLRFFAKLHELLPYLNIEEETLNHLEQIFNDFLKFLQRRKNTLFLSEYDDPRVFVEQQEGNEE
ncbi:hypothetical protein Lal_00021748 [Lupinus albus]|uniref:Putative chromatin remodeling & transcriptional activation CHROMO-DOMAIN family n=1 Tax=Lupinus albus TaxID=3870 RepID=A0A6A4MWZ7_LUPAL|nr:putative chromatin remodeling & transcriptional activation CHROMO-DOMAIN family [Lupinus albus]KAF1865748.1 hypothetical protein Lal_00021748 [Lupinus albus]